MLSFTRVITLAILPLALLASSLQPTLAHSNPESNSPATNEDAFTFSLTADMREFSGPGAYDTSQYFRGAVEAIEALGAGAFMVSPGDIDPPLGARWTITQTLGTDYPWYPVVGNHEEETASDMIYLRGYDYGTVNPGPSGCPETTYSFDYANVHFAVLNEYCDSSGDDVTHGDVPDHLYDWLAADLAATSQEHIFVLGHEPAYPLPDEDNGRLRHESDSLNAFPINRTRFWDLLKSEEVLAYICGHTHNYSLAGFEGVWQLDAGHARGLGDTGAASTFILVHVDELAVTYETYRYEAQSKAYVLRYGGALAGPQVFLPVVRKP
jgi:hypothetical protein